MDMNNRSEVDIIISELRKINAQISVKDQNLEINCKKGVLQDELKILIKENKDQLIEYIKQGKTNGIKKIPKTPLRENYILSSSQKRIWILSQFKESNSAYNMPVVYTFEGNVDIKSLEASFQSLINRHEILRTIFKENEQGEVRQFILPENEIIFQIPFYDLTLTDKNEQEIQELTNSEATKTFDLSQGPLLRAQLIQTKQNTFLFTLTMHHIVSDGWSMELMIRELLTYYNYYSKGETVEVLPLPLQYKDYAAWEQQQIQEEQLNQHKSYWMKQFEGELPILEFPTDKTRPTIKTYNGWATNKKIDKDLTSGLKAICKEKETTLFMGLLATVNTLLYRYSNQTDIVIGSPIAGREHFDLQDQIGCYLNVLPFRARFSEDDSFYQLLEGIKKTTLEAFEHQIYPFDQLIGDLNLSRNISRSALFDVMLVLQNIELNSSKDTIQLDGLSASHYSSDYNVSKFDLTITCSESNDELDVRFEYNTDLFSERTIQRLSDHLEQLLAAIIKNPNLSISMLDFLNQNEKNELLIDFNDTKVDYPSDKTVIDLFEEQVQLTPDNIAVVFENNQLTYLELNNKANLLADYLINRFELKPNDFVGILLDKSEWVIVSILAILKTGAVYVPIDPEYPEERKKIIIEDTQIKALITNVNYIFDLENYKEISFAIDVEFDSITAMENVVRPSITPQDLMYVMYTSGSTGKPKGVMVQHQNAVRLVKSTNFLQVKSTDTLLSTGAISFDATTFEYWGALLNGAKLVLCNNSSLLSATSLKNMIDHNHVNTAWFTAPLLNQLVDQDVAIFEKLDRIVVGGDRLSPSHIYQLKNRFPKISITNGYGPTENTTFSLTYEIQNEFTNIPIGSPIHNSTAYILDSKLKLQPIGVVGEICVGGDGVAKGYLNAPELTNEKFVANPFLPNQKMYRTGDLGRWLPNGIIEFIGRKDDQVKIRGFRIEIGEIESVLQTHQLVDMCTLLVKEDENRDKKMIAYFVSKEKVNQQELKSYLSEKLPNYMVPHFFIQVEKIILNANGKIDKRELPVPDELKIETGVEFIQPRNETEVLLAQIWSNVLSVNEIGVLDNFFDLGGDSIKVIRILSELKKNLEIELSVADLYKNTTIDSLSEFIRHNKIEINSKSIVQLELKKKIEQELFELKEIVFAKKLLNQEEIADVFPMSAIEKGMAFESILDIDKSIYHDLFAYQRQFQNFDSARFSKALELLVEKHPMLRTGFDLSKYDKEIQIVYKKIELPLTYYNVEEKESFEQEKLIQNYCKEQLAKPFNLETCPLWRMTAFNCGKNEIVLVWEFHHAILDGWSHASFLTELNNLYLLLEDNPGFIPANLKSSYRDFIIQQEVDNRDPEIRNYWYNELAGYERLDLFTEEDELQQHHIALDKNYLEKLELASKELHCTVKSLSMSAYMYLLKILNYHGDILTGLITNNRLAQEDGDKVLGCFLNSTPFRYNFENNSTCVELIKSINDKLSSLKHYEKLSTFEIAKMHDKKNDRVNPLFDSIFNYIDFYVFNSLENSPKAEEKSKKREINLIGHERTNTYFDFTIDTTDGNYNIILRLTKKMKLNLPIEKLGDLYCKILAFFIENPNSLVSESNLLSENDTTMLENVFNNTAIAYPEKKTIIELFEEQVQKTPNNIALNFEDKKFTYLELNQLSNQLCDYLKKSNHIVKDDLVGVKLERNEWLIISMLSILKSGAAYVPIDISYPTERIEFIVKDSNCKLIIDESLISNFSQDMSSYSRDNSVTSATSANLVYAIYTSGTTGKPKGVLVEHTALVNLCSWHNRTYRTSENTVATVYSSFSFDAFGWEVFPYLIAGAKIVLLSESVRYDLEKFTRLITEEKVTNVFLPTSLFDNLVAEKGIEGLSSIQNLLIGGDKLKSKSIGVNNLYNNYGPTENTVVTTSCMIRLNENITIGKPIDNTQIYIFGNNFQQLPIGIIGEIYIGGKSLARGYHQRHELTNENFVMNPFDEKTRLYKTGDLGRWLSNGTIEFIKRKDDQVKIRGFRIELSEIENTLTENENVISCVVIAKEIDQDKDLVAFVVCKDKNDVEQIRIELQNKLPDYMVPHHIIELEKMPLTHNGKLNLQELHNYPIEFKYTSKNYQAPTNEVEEKLVDIFENVIGIQGIGVTDNFFEIGGDSFKSMRVAYKIQEAFDVKIELVDFFNEPTIEMLALEIENVIWLNSELS